MLQSGLWLTYDRANLAQQPLGLFAVGGSTPNDPFDVGFALDADAVSGDQFTILDIEYIGPDLEYVVKQAGGNLWTLTTSVDSAARSVLFNAVAARIPEPSTWLLVVVALVYPAARRLWPCVRPGPRTRPL